MSEQPPPPPYPGWVPPGPAPPPLPPPAGLPQSPSYGAPPAYGYPAPYGVPTNPYFTNPNAGPPPPQGVAITALVLSLIPIMFTQVVAVILGIIVLKRVGRGEARGKGMAIAALIISGVILVLGTVGLILGDPEENPKSGEQTPSPRASGSGDIGVLRAKAGDCLATIPVTEPVFTVKILPCARPHRGEIYATFKVDANSSSEQPAINRLAEGGCATRFKRFIGIGFDKSRLELLYLPPLRRSVDFSNRVICIAVDPVAKTVTGTLKNSKR